MTTTLPRSAILSDCKRYRYSLTRTLLVTGKPKVFVWIGVNPSTADHEIDDQTIKKMREFTRTAGGTELVVANLFAYRATDVTDLRRAHDPVGELTDMHLSEAIQRADVIVPCWGRRGKLPASLRYRVAAMAERMDRAASDGLDVRCLGRTRSGDPLHPQMLAYVTPLVPWQSAA